MDATFLRERLTSLGKTALDLLYPERCAGCHAFGRSLCAHCSAALVPLTTSGRCPMCSARWTGERNCDRCYSMQQIERVHAAFEMEGVPRRMVHGLKYRGVRSLAAPMAAAIEPLAAAVPPAAWFPVPLHRSRERERGFNQAALLLQHLGIPAYGGGELRRERKTERQVGRRARERQRNVSGAFAYRGDPLDGQSVVLLDDVVTTGATVTECAATLRDHGARRVYVVAFARASYDVFRPGAPIDD